MPSSPRSPRLLRTAALVVLSTLTIGAPAVALQATPAPPTSSPAPLQVEQPDDGAGYLMRADPMSRRG